MKKLLLSLVFLLILAVDTSAQFSKGDFFIDGTILLNQKSTELIYNIGSNEGVVLEEKSFFTRLTPSFNFFATDLLAISIGLGMNYAHVESPQAIFNGSNFSVLKTEYTIKSYLITSGARLYHPLSEKVSIYTGIQTLVGKGTLKTNNPIPNFLNSDTFDFEASLRHGISYQVSPSILLSASTSSVYFFFSRTTPDGSDLDLDETDFGLDNFGSLGLSVAYKF